MASSQDNLLTMLPEIKEVVLNDTFHNKDCNAFATIIFEQIKEYNARAYSELREQLFSGEDKLNQILSDQFNIYENILNDNLIINHDILGYIHDFPFPIEEPPQDKFTPMVLKAELNEVGREPLQSDEKYSSVLSNDIRIVAFVVCIIFIFISDRLFKPPISGIIITVELLFLAASLLFPKKIWSVIKGVFPTGKRAWKVDHENWSKAKRKYEQELKELKTKLSEIETKNILEGKRIDRINAERLAHYYNQKDMFRSMLDSAYEYLKIGLQTADEKAINDYFHLAILTLKLPYSFPREVRLKFVPDRKALLIFFRLPSEENILSVKEFRFIKSKQCLMPILLKQKEQDTLYEKVLCQIALSVLSHLFACDKGSYVETIYFQGWLRYLDKSVGNIAEPTVMTLQVSKELALSINFNNVDPVECFNKRLKGVCATKVKMIVPVQPIIILDKNDPRFVNGYDVISTVNAETNIATMEWQDFENLVRDLFEKKYCSGDQEVKITRSSRDKGVDAVLFDPDPIRGGKIIIQAKRYINTVPVSAVRDLYGTVMSEGANRGDLPPIL